MKFRLLLEYDGTDYCGWQVQPNGRSVQATLESALHTVLGHPARVSSAGRTDAGVHAAGQVACFSTPRDVNIDRLLRALNALTPRDLSVTRLDVVSDDFDPRRDAGSRTYRYRIWNRRVPSPFWRPYAWHIARPLDDTAMADAAKLLVGEHDFSAFRAAGCDADHPVRRVLRSEVHRSGDLVRYEIEATAFLRHMVRNIVGTLVDVGNGVRAAADITTLLERRDRTAAGMTAPAHGLCLLQVSYGVDAARRRGSD